MAAERRRQGQQLYAQHGTHSRRPQAATPFPLTQAGKATQPQPPALPPEARPCECDTNKAKQPKRDKVFLNTTHSWGVWVQSVSMQPKMWACVCTSACACADVFARACAYACMCIVRVRAYMCLRACVVRVRAHACTRVHAQMRVCVRGWPTRARVHACLCVRARMRHVHVHAHSRADARACMCKACVHR